MTDTKSVLVSGVKPTGDLHIGNYFGAMRQFRGAYQRREVPPRLSSSPTIMRSTRRKMLKK